MDNRTRMVTFVSGDITLEGVLHLLEQPPSPGVLICHPHPLYGGNMHNNVVTAISGALVEKGLAALRFNFRGVGGSEGSYANGVGEQQDVAAGIAYLRQLPEIDPSSVGVAGYSFGAIQALYAGAEAPRAIAAISTPTSGLDLSGHFLLCPLLLVAGQLDRLADPASLGNLRGLAPQAEIDIVPGADHFWRGMEGRLAEIVSDFFARTLADRSPA